MIPLFLGLTVANLLVLILTFGVGLAVPSADGGVSGWHAYHVGLGVASGLMAALAHVSVFTYFMATTKWLGAATDKAACDESLWVRPAARNKSRAFVVSMAGVSAVVLAMMAGAAADPTVRPWWSGRVHLVAAAAAVVVNGLCAVAQYGLIRRQGALMDGALAVLNGAGSASEAGVSARRAGRAAVTVGVGLLVLGLAGACGTAGAEPVAATMPAGEGAGERDAGERDAELGWWLERIEERAASVKTLSAQVRYDRIQGLVGDRQRRFGWLYYRSGPPARFAVHFDRLLVDRRVDRQERWYIYDGEWLVERHDDEKLFIKRQVGEPGAGGGGGRASGGGDPLALGRGPFPIPVTFKKDEVLARYEVALVRDHATPGAGAVHLRLVPRRPGSDDVVEVDLWYDRETVLPTRVRTVDGSENESDIELAEVVVNRPIEAGVLDTSAPKGPGWRVEVKPWED